MTARSVLMLALIAGALSCRTFSNPGGAEPDALLELSAKSLSAGVGYSWGAGTLTYQGKTYAVDVDGLMVGAVGLSSVTAKGGVFNLTSLDDFDGNYTAVSGGAAIGEGGAGVVMRNVNQVEVRLVAETKGLTLNIGQSGVKLTIEKPAAKE
jgi:hypothetical protein